MLQHEPISEADYVRWFSDIRLRDVGLVGGKTASLGELYANLSAYNVRVPNGFAITAQAYRDALTAAMAWDALRDLLEKLDKADIALLSERAAKARSLVYEATGNDHIRNAVARAYARLEAQYGRNLAVAVRSSATAEDLANAGRGIARF
jgi:pyruvate, water dikinase